MKRWRLLEKKRNKSGKFKSEYNIIAIDGNPTSKEVLRFATGGLVDNDRYPRFY